MPLVAIVAGSASDSPYIEQTVEVLIRLGVSYETFTMSAHRAPHKVLEFAASARKEGFEVVIAMAGMAAHLPGVIAAWCPLPVIGVPLPGSDLKGMDALLSIVQMPAGVPVATVAIGHAGARNAGYLAAQMLSIKYPEIRATYDQHREAMAAGGRG
jgi:5-(carboxyamino)imidazole ribonucleotide mutase